MIYLDTHIVAWLYAGLSDRLSESARALLQNQEPYISPMVCLELQYLFEIGRVKHGSDQVVQALAGQLGLRVCDRPFAEVVHIAQRQVWTRDPFDRIIVAQAALGPDMLITKDETIRANYAGGKW